MIDRIKTIEILDKLTNFLTLYGKKSKSEKGILQSFKTLQKICKESSKEVLIYALHNNILAFRLNKIVKKKKQKKKKQEKKTVRPGFVLSPNSKISLAIRFILDSIPKKTKKKDLITKPDSKPKKKKTKKLISKEENDQSTTNSIFKKKSNQSFFDIFLKEILLAAQKIAINPETHAHNINNIENNIINSQTKNIDFQFNIMDFYIKNIDSLMSTTNLKNNLIDFQTNIIDFYINKIASNESDKSETENLFNYSHKNSIQSKTEIQDQIQKLKYLIKYYRWYSK